jgi:hypothetical protein
MNYIMRTCLKKKKLWTPIWPFYSYRKTTWKTRLLKASRRDYNLILIDKLAIWHEYLLITYSGNLMLYWQKYLWKFFLGSLNKTFQSVHNEQAFIFHDFQMLHWTHVWEKKLKVWAWNLTLFYALSPSSSFLVLVYIEYSWYDVMFKS